MSDAERYSFFFGGVVGLVVGMIAMVGLAWTIARPRLVPDEPVWDSMQVAAAAQAGQVVPVAASHLTPCEVVAPENECPSMLELLSTEATPCGFTEPTPGVIHAACVWIPAQYGGEPLDPDVARWFATAILRAADVVQQR